MKAHVGVNAESSIVRRLETTTTEVRHSQVWDALLRGNETSGWRTGTASTQRPRPPSPAGGKFWDVMRKAATSAALDSTDADINRIIASPVVAGSSGAITGDCESGSSILSACSSANSANSRPATAG